MILKEFRGPVKTLSPASHFGNPSREKANLAVTVANEEDDIVAHASFLDHPVGELVDQADWELFLHQNFSTESCTVCIIDEFKQKVQRSADAELFSGYQSVCC